MATWGARVESLAGARERGLRDVDGEQPVARRASRSVSTPIEQPTSSALAIGRSGSAAIVASYFARS